jgi:hypothetical protein
MIGKNGNKFENLELFDFIYLVDSSLDLSKIKDMQNDSTLIVSFDYDSHQQLNQKQIYHLRSDEFLSEVDINEIQKVVYRFIKWYDENQIQNFIKYDTINIGKLFHEETLDYLVKFIKSYFEIKIIFQKYSSAKFFTSPTLYEILKIFTSSIQKLTSSQLNSHNYANDQIRVNFNIGKKYFMFFISKSTYKKIKKLYEKFVHLMMGPKKFSDSNKKNILLIEFNTVRFEEFFLAKKPQTVTLSFLGRRRPAFWNRNSYSIFKKSNTKIISPYAIDQTKLESDTKQGILLMKNNLQSLWENEDFFKNFFSVENMSIWESIKPTFFELLENRLENTIYEIELCKSILNNYHFDSILILSEIGFTEQVIANLAKLHKIPVVLIQPGLYYDTIEANEMNNSQTVYPNLSDKFVVWGNTTKQDSLINAKIPSNKIEVLGSPRFSKQKLLNSKNGDYILLATSAPQPADIHGLLVKNIENYENAIIQISKIAAQLKKPLIIKLHPSPNEPDVNALISQIDHDITVVTSGDIFPLLESCSVMVVLGLSTAIIEAQLLHKPVISIPVIDYKWGNPEVFKSNSCVISDINSLKDNLEKIFYDIKFRNNVIHNADLFIKNYFVNLGFGPEKIFQYLSKL